ncbi:MAG: DUF362 domain-containing protein, partial [Myxococcota bacterium]
MPSKVYFSSSRASSKLNGIKKLERLFNRAGLGSLFGRGDRTAVKVHWGEPGNTAFVAVPFVRKLTSLVAATGARPFVTDTNTLYTGMRHDAIINIEAAAMNGFTRESMGAPVIVADGLVGADAVPVPVNGRFVKEAKIAGAIHHAQAMLVVSHFKGHVLFSFGAAIKNLGMGCATSAGKHVLHCDVKPTVDKKLCRGDSICIRHCPAKCISLDGDMKAVIDHERCIGCGECVVVCPERAMPVNWKASSEALQGKTAEYALAAVQNKPGKVGYVNFLTRITTDCDCADWSDNPLVQDIGYLASTDPVAIDQASIDLFNAAAALPDSDLGGRPASKDKLRALRPSIDYEIILRHA